MALNKFVSFYLFWIVRDLPVWRDKQNVLRLQVGMCQFALVQKLHSIAHLVSDVPHLVQCVRVVAVFLLQENPGFKTFWDFKKALLK